MLLFTLILILGVVSLTSGNSYLLRHRQTGLHNMTPSKENVSNASTTSSEAWYRMRWETQKKTDKQQTITKSTVEFVVHAHRNWAPASFDRFQQLVRSGFLDQQYLVRAVPGFVLDFNYGPTGGKAAKAAWEDYENDLEWFAPNSIEPKFGGTQQPNTIGTLSFGQEEDGRTKTEVFFNTGAKNSPRLDKLGFWPFAKIFQTTITTTTQPEGVDGADSKEEAATITTTLESTNKKWVQKVEAAMNTEYGDIFFADGANDQKAKIRQSLLIAGGNDYIARAYPNMTRLILIEELSSGPP